MTTRGEPTRQDAGLDAGDLAALVARASRGDERAWEDLVRLYARRVYALAQSRLRRPDLAEEITQSVFVTLATKLRDDAYAEQGRFEPWLFRVAMNRVRDAARKLKRQAASIEPGIIQAVADTPAPARDDTQLQSLREALHMLNDADREVVELRHHGQMGFKDIAALLDQPVGTVLARHHRALKKLRSLLDPGGDVEDRS